MITRNKCDKEVWENLDSKHKREWERESTLCFGNNWPCSRPPCPCPPSHSALSVFLSPFTLCPWGVLSQNFIHSLGVDRGLPSGCESLVLQFSIPPEGVSCRMFLGCPWTSLLRGSSPTALTPLLSPSIRPNILCSQQTPAMTCNPFF